MWSNEILNIWSGHYFNFGPTCKHMFIFIWKVHSCVNHLWIGDMCNICPTHNICNNYPTFLILICNTCPTRTICTKTATCPTCTICSHLMIWAICILRNTWIICIKRIVSNIITSIPQVNEWCMKQNNCNIDVPFSGVKCMCSTFWPFEWKNALF